jgi:hypothetical protein
MTPFACIYLRPIISSKYLDRVLTFIASRTDAWITTSDEIASHYRKIGPTPLLLVGVPKLYNRKLM